MALDVTDYAGGNDLTNSNVAEDADVPAGLTGCTVSAKITRAESDWLYITDANQTGLDFSSTMTVEFWMKLTTNNNYMFIIAKDDDSANNKRSYWVSVGSTKLTMWVCKGDGTFDAYRYDTAVATGEWHHWAITADVGNASATTFEFFKDGSSVGNGVAEQTGNISAINNGGSTFTIGDRCGSGTTGEGSRLDGYLTDVRLWSDVRTATEINNNKGVRLTGSEEGLVSYWPFETLSSPVATVKSPIQTTNSKFFG
jgi:hypothetical protein